jgi:hypothetical protein
LRKHFGDMERTRIANRGGNTFHLD